jgi:hypothetical protein
MNIGELGSLEQIKLAIEKMNKYHQIEILKILSANSCKLNENKSGVYVNLSFLSNESLDKLKQYIEYNREQEDSLDTIEYQKKEFQNSFFIEKENKDEQTILYSSINQK